MELFSILTTVLSGLGGGLLRLLPELIGLWNKRTDNSHELAMMGKQIELETLQAAQRRAQAEQAHGFVMDEASLKGSIEMGLRSLDANREALVGQMQLTKIWWVDALNMLVRPLTTYFFLGAYGIVKTATIAVALRTTDPWVSIIQCWTPEDVAILFAILGFWFVGRTFEKKQ